MNRFILLAERKFQTTQTTVELYAAELILNNMIQQGQYKARQVTQLQSNISHGFNHTKFHTITNNNTST